MADEVILLDFWASPFGLRVKIALEEKGVKYECKEEDLLDKSPLLAKMNPIHKKIPVLIHNGNTICESLIIVEYIDEFWKSGSPLLPQDPYERANARVWAEFVGKTIYDCGRTLWQNKGEVNEAAGKELLAHLKIVEEKLGEKPYFAGDHFGFVDIALVCFTCWFLAYETCGNFSIEEVCPKLIAWAKRCLERESVSKSLPDPQKVNDFLITVKKKFGVE